jgi:hypothetical protein
LDKQRCLNGFDRVQSGWWSSLWFRSRRSFDGCLTAAELTTAIWMS